ncbi:MAG: DUF1573 domain-containing protein [Bacteroidales bacterium]
MKKKFNILTILLAFIYLMLNIHLVYSQNEFEGVVKFDKTIYDFGNILISDGSQSCTFTLTNISKNPIVINRVITSCGCTNPKWTKSPIKPGQIGYIKIQYSNDLGPYPFDKSITAYIYGLSRPVQLRIRGIAHAKKKSISELYPYQIGALGLSMGNIDLGQLSQTKAIEEEIEIANISSRPITIKFADTTPGMKLLLKKNKIPAHKTVKITVIIDTKKNSKILWGKNTYKTKFIINGKKYSKELKIEILIKENFDNLNENQKRTGSLPYFNSSSSNIGSVKSGVKKNITFTCKNTGREKLKIYKVESNILGVKIDYPNTIDSGSTSPFQVSFTTPKKKGELMIILTIITNSPLRPLINIIVSGEII